MARKRKGRDISGWIVIDKPAGITSTAVVNKVKWALEAKKAGHAGTLDPEATGVLAVALGEATKTVPYITDALKAYSFTVRLGQATNTDDAEGEVITFVDELHTIVGAGGAEGAMDAGNMIKPMLARGELRMIGATTLDEYRKYVEKDPALERRFQQVYVGEPSVEDTIGILRGLKERYEVHHGVRIQDSALVSAAVLSDRYITSRFLPDKAIDLMDEAASKLRIEIDSLPTEIDVVQRRIFQLEIEQVALEKESDKASAERLEMLHDELAQLNASVSEMKENWEREKQAIDAIRSLKEELEGLRTQIDRESDLELAAESRYGRIPELERRIEEATAHVASIQEGGAMLKEEVDAEDIADRARASLERASALERTIS